MHPDQGFRQSNTNWAPRALALLVAGLVLAGCTTRNAGPPPIDATRRDPRAGITVPADQARFILEPISAVPADKSFRLLEAVTTEARARGVTIARDTETGVPYRVKGYISAVGGPSGAILVYVWDIVDANGTRLHRISGQEPSVGGAPDPWAGISDSTLRLAAQRTADALAAWVRR